MSANPKSAAPGGAVVSGCLTRAVATVLVEEPTLEAVMSRPELRQLKQRVSRHVRLEPLGIIEMVRTGQVAMRRGDVALSATQYS